MFEQVTLEEHISTQKGFAFKSKWFIESGRKIVKVSDFTADSVNANNLVNISEELGNQYSRYSLSTGNVVIQTVGSWPSNPASVVGKTIRIPKSVHGALLNQNAVKIIPNRTMQIGFLFYLLRCDDFKEYIIGTAQGAASQASITLESIKGYKFFLPDLNAQTAIAEYLENYDNLIENNNRRIAILEDMAQSLYREWFVNFRYPGHADNVDKDGNQKLIDSPLGQIPEGWAVKKFTDVVNYKTGKLNSNAAVADGDYPFFTCSRETFKTNTWSFDCECVLLAGNNANAIYPIKYFNGKFDAYQRTYVITEKNRSEITPSFLFYCLEIKLNQLKNISTGTSTRFLTKGILDNLDLLVPTSKLMSEFNSIVLNLLNSQGNLRKRNENLKKQRDMLLPKLISGQIEL